MPISRRAFLASTVATSAAIAGCGRPTPSGPKGEFSGQTLRVFVYAGGHEKTMSEVFVPQFERETGARVVLETGWWDAIAKLKASPGNKPPFDLMITDATQGYPAAREGLFQKINVRNIPNLANLVPSALDNWIVKDGHGITYPDAVMTLAYRKDQVGNPPASWKDLLREDLKGKIGLYNSFYMSLYTFACILADREGKAGEAAKLIASDLDGVLKFARGERDRVRIWWPTSTDMILALDHKDCAAGNMQSPEMLQALEENKALGAVVPVRDRVFVQVFWAIPAGTSNTDLAERAINSIFSNQMQLGFARHGSATAIPEVARQRAEEDPFWKQIYPHTSQQLADIRYYPYDEYFKHWNDISQYWQREILKRG